jgi:hypothetical protein
MLPELGQFLLRRLSAVGRDRLCERPVDRKQVHITKRRRLIEHLMGNGGGIGHGALLMETVEPHWLRAFIGPIHGAECDLPQASISITCFTMSETSAGKIHTGRIQLALL